MTKHYGFNLVIVAGGLGSRLAPVTNYVPKFLVNIGKNTGYVEQIRYWMQQADHFDPTVNADLVEAEPNLQTTFDQLASTITVIVHSNYEELVRAYHELYFPNITLTIKTVDVANGSAHAILSTCQHLNDRSVMFSWCDIIPDVPIPIDEIGERFRGDNVIFTNYHNSNRYGLTRVGKGWEEVKPFLEPEERGGCFGLYWINNFHTDTVQYNDGQDFIEIISQYGSIREQRLEHIIDFGDMPKLVRTRARADEAREFNKIEFLGDFVVKTATNDQGRKIMEKEINWYRELGRLTPNGTDRISVPKAWIGTDQSSLILNKVPGVPVWKAWPDLSPADRHHVLSQIIEQRELLFNLSRRDVVGGIALTDVRAEAGDKLHARFNEIEDVINSFGKIKRVNGEKLETSNPHKLIDRLTAKLCEYYERCQNEYGFIHGDLQMSNSMVDLDTRKVWIIDPRGYFGKSTASGLADYDIGKLLYSLTGYDLFNYSKTFHISRLEGGDIDFKIPTPDLSGVEDILANKFSKIHHLWLAVIWMGLAQYIKNDPVKSVCAHYHGMIVGERALRLFN